MLWSDPVSSLVSGLAVWPGLFLVAGGTAKALELRDPDAGQDTVLARALPRRVRLRPAWAALGGAELVAGALVLSGLPTPWPELAAALLLAAAAGVALWGMRAVPQAGCGCFGTRSAPVSARTPLRAGALALLALAAALAGSGWTSALGDPVAVAVMLAAGVALVAATPELDLRRRARAGRHHVRETACAHRRVPPERTIARLRASLLWAEARRYLAAESPLEQWREGCWRYLVYPASYEGEAATAVFALYLGRDRSADGVAFVDERDQRVLGQINGRRK